MRETICFGFFVQQLFRSIFPACLYVFVYVHVQFYSILSTKCHFNHRRIKEVLSYPQCSLLSQFIFRPTEKRLDTAVESICKRQTLWKKNQTIWHFEFTEKKIGDTFWIYICLSQYWAPILSSHIHKVSFSCFHFTSQKYVFVRFTKLYLDVKIVLLALHEKKIFCLKMPDFFH